ncbi:MAG: hypothetical protein KDD98_08395 [Sphingomonadaceae bacterium]|nr:hypothetical protein [Sphingomonadaceae bacterium]
MSVRKIKLPASPWFRLLLALAVVQAAFWFIFDPNFIHVKPAKVDRVEVTRLEYARVTAPTAAALQAARFTNAIEGPILLQRGYHASRASFSLDAVPATGLAILANDSGDNRQIYVNGNLLSGEGQMELAGLSFHGPVRTMVRAPAGLLHNGQNQIETIVAVDVPFEGVLPPPLVGEYKAFERAFAWPRFMFSTIEPASIAIGLTISLFLLVALIRASSRDFLVWFFILNTLWTMNALYRAWPTLAIHGYPRLLLDALVTFGLAASWPVFVDAWSGKTIRWFRWLIYAAMGLGAAYCCYWYVIDQSPTAFIAVGNFLNISGLCFILATFLRMTWHFWRHGDDRIWEAALLLSLGLLLALALVGTVTGGPSGGYLSRSQPLFLLLFAVAYFARNFRLFQSSAQINEMLQTQLVARTTELEAAHARETQLVRRQAHDDERQRIMRDMHDGLGSNLMSMLLAARRGDAKPEAVAEGLQSVVDEMRLMIDSMDSVGESLASALATFRERVQSRVEAAGFAFNWRNDTGRDLPELGPREVLQIFRIMQEAVTNALKHSGGNALDIAISKRDNAIRIAITDNGKGMQGMAVTGHGMDNMRARAAAIGAQIAHVSSGNGVTVQIDLPAQTGEGQ